MIIYPAGSGVIIEDGVRIAIDVPRRVKGAVHIVTHAHYDHIGALREGSGFTSPATADVLRERGLEALGVKRIEVGEVEAGFIEAGHIVGSSQVLLLNGRDVLVTGDFKFEKDAVTGGAETVDVDILVMDTTFSVPEYRFPPRKELYRKIKDLVKENLGEGRSVVLFGYSVGKAQELTALLNTMGVDPLVLSETHRVNRLFGLRDRVVTSPPSRPAVYILPPRFRKVLDAFSVQTGVPFTGVFCSGWNPELPLSSHADWEQTVRFVEKVSPEVVVTYGMNAERSAVFLREEGFNAIPLRNPVFI